MANGSEEVGLDSIAFFRLPADQQLAIISELVSAPYPGPLDAAVAQRILTYFQSIAVRKAIAELDGNTRPPKNTPHVNPHDTRQQPDGAAIRYGVVADSGNGPVTRTSELANFLTTDGSVAGYYKRETSKGRSSRKVSIKELDFTSVVNADDGFIEMDEISCFGPLLYAQNLLNESTSPGVVVYPSERMALQSIYDLERFAVNAIYLAQTAKNEGLDVDLASVRTDLVNPEADVPIGTLGAEFRVGGESIDFFSDGISTIESTLQNFRGVLNVNSKGLERE